MRRSKVLACTIQSFSLIKERVCRPEWLSNKLLGNFSATFAIRKTVKYDANFSWLVWVRHSMVGKVKVFRGTPIVWAVFTYSFWRRSSLQAVSFLRISWSLNRACVGKGFYYSRDRVGRPSVATWLCSGHLAKQHFLAWFPRRVW